VRDLHACLKHYDLRVPEFASPRVAVSTRTGRLASMDDFWASGAGLLVLETTMHNFNQNLYDEYVRGHPDCVLCWMRAIVATFTTTSGRDWTQKFIRYNSGTYNNEYVVLDTKKWEAGKPLAPDLVWMLEQMPGTIVRADVTEVLANKTYLESINAPQFELIWNVSDAARAQDEEPEKAGFYSFDGQIRETLIRRDAPRLATYEAFQDFMQYNDYLNDPDQVIPGTNPPQREPAQGILSRYDLRPPNGTDWGARRHFGGLDVKSLRVSTWLANHAWDAKLGMAANLSRGIPPFNFSDWPMISHKGIAEIPVYDWTVFSPGDMCAVITNAGDDGACLQVPGCGFCTATQECMSGSKDGPDGYFGKTCEVGWEFNVPLEKWVLGIVIALSVTIFLFIVSVYAVHFYRRYKSLTKFETI
jgi:hypothetical protein